MRLRKMTAILTALALLLSIAPPAAGTDVDTHTCNFVLVATRQEPTCTAPGTGLYRCICGKSRIQTIPALGHSWGGWTTTQAATCGKAGAKARTCSRCGSKETGSIPATGAHTWGSWKITQETDCLVPGLMKRSCYTCGQTETQTLPAPGHDWDEGTMTKEAGLFEDGEIIYTCRRNHAHIKKEAVPAAETAAYRSGESAKGFLNRLRGIPTGNEEAGPLEIAEQPRSTAGPVNAEESVILTVKATGGTEPYSYTWHKEIPWMTEAGAADQLMPVVGTDSPELALYGYGGRFFCIVTDLAGNRVRSETAEAAGAPSGEQEAAEPGLRSRKLSYTAGTRTGETGLKTYHFSFEGGNAPYHIEIYSTETAGEWTGDPGPAEGFAYNSVLRREYTVFSEKDLQDIQYSGMPDRRRISFEEGMPKTVKIPVYYKTVVTDATGEACESAYLN